MEWIILYIKIKLNEETMGIFLITRRIIIKEVQNAKYC